MSLGFLNLKYIQQVGYINWAWRYGVFQFRKRILGRDTRITLPTGAPLILPRVSNYSGSVYVTQAHVDWGSEAVMADLADPDRDFLDIGSHFGYYANYLSPRVRKVFAFEPDPRNLPLLRANAALVRNVEVVPVAVSSSDGSASLHIRSSTTTSSLEGTGPGITVSKTSVDSFVAAHPGMDVGLVKTDIEEHDIEALRGMSRTVARCQPLILTECACTQTLGNLCADWGYSMFAFTRRLSDISKTRMERIHGPDDGAWYAMVFLVPRHRTPYFDSAAADANSQE